MQLRPSQISLIQAEIVPNLGVGQVDFSCHRLIRILLQSQIVQSLTSKFETLIFLVVSDRPKFHLGTTLRITTLDLYLIYQPSSLVNKVVEWGIWAKLHLKIGLEMEESVIDLFDKVLTDLFDTLDGYFFCLQLYYPLLIWKRLVFNEWKVFHKTFLIEFKFEEYRIGAWIFQARKGQPKSLVLQIVQRQITIMFQKSNCGVFFKTAPSQTPQLDTPSVHDSLRFLLL